MSIIYAYINLVPVTLMQSVIYAFAALGIMISFACCRFLISPSRARFHSVAASRQR